MESTTIPETEMFLDKTTLFLRVGLSFLFRIGSILIQVSSIPVSNVNLILMQNIIEILTATIVFFVFGFTIIFGDLIEPEWSIGSIFVTNNKTEIEYAIYAWTAITTTTAIFTTMTAGRMHVGGYVVITMFLSGLLEPIAMRVAWTPDSYARNNTFLGANVTYVDFGGVGHVHLLAGTAAVLATIFIGRRLIRLKDIDEASLPSGAEASMMIGYLLVIAGTIGLMLPHPMLNGTMNDAFGMKCGLAIIGGMLVALLAEFIVIRRKLNSWAIARCLQGGLAGLVAVSSGTLMYPPLVCLMLGAVGGLFFYIVQHFMFKTSLEDYCNVIPIHFYCGYFSVLLTLRLADLTYVALAQFAWEILVSVCLIGVYIVCLLPVFLLLMVFGILRNRQCEIDYNRAMKVHRSQRNGGFLARLFPPGSKPELLVPGSRVREVEYQDQRLTEEVMIDLKPDGSSANRKRRVEDDDAGNNRKKVNRSDVDEAIEELDDLQTFKEMKPFDVMLHRTHSYLFKKSRKHRMQGRKRLSLGDGDCDSELVSIEGKAEKLTAHLEDLSEELAEKKESPKSSSEIPESNQDKNKGKDLNVSQRITVMDSETVKEDECLEFVNNYDYKNFNDKEDEFVKVGDVKGVVGKNGLVKTGSELGRRDVEKVKESVASSKSGWVYKAAHEKNLKEDGGYADDYTDKWFGNV